MNEQLFLTSEKENLPMKKMHKLNKLVTFNGCVFGLAAGSIVTEIPISIWIKFLLLFMGGVGGTICIYRQNKLKSVIKELHKIQVKQYIKY